MKNKPLGEKQTRRDFLGTSAVLATGAFLPFSKSYGNSKHVTDSSAIQRSSALNSNFGGVQIGAITYSFRDLEGGLEATLKACVDAGLSSVELMGTGVEDYLGAPANPIRRWPSREKPFSDDERSQLEKYRNELKEWRKTHGTIDKYVALRKKFNDAGVNIHIYKWTAGNSDEELDYSFQVAKALGAIGITTELNEENARLIGPAAERNGMYSILHNHFQFAEEGFDVDKLLAYSPANMLNFDVGHYFGSTGLNPADFIKKYHKRIASIHIKDKTGKNNETEQNANQVWGQGETPLEEVLLLIKENKWPIYCDIELEYQIAPWSSSVKEVKTCRNYCRQILL
jgi:sugar phosphate isomerase/epimerase